MEWSNWEVWLRRGLSLVFVLGSLLLAACGGGNGSDGGGGAGGGGNPGPISEPGETSINAVGFNTGMLVRVGGAFTSTTNHIEYSTNGGSSWTAASGCPGGMNDVQYSASKSKWIAGGGLYDPGKSQSVPQICESADGINWTVNGDNNFSGYGLSTFITAIADADVLALGGSPDGSQCFETELPWDGSTWGTVQDCVGVPARPYSVTVAASGYFAVGGPSPSFAHRPAYVAGGGSWTTYLGTPKLTAIERHFDGVTLAMIAGTDTGALYRATDLFTLEAITSPTSEAIVQIRSNLTDAALAVGGNGLLMSSADGVTWTVQNSGTTQHLRGAVWDGDNSRFVIVGDGGTTLTF